MTTVNRSDITTRKKFFSNKWEATHIPSGIRAWADNEEDAIQELLTDFHITHREEYCERLEYLKSLGIR